MFKQVHAAYILVKWEDQACDLLERINSGESFGELARRFSKCRAGKNVGDLRCFGRGQMFSEFEKAAFDGQKKAVGSSVKTQFGYHLISIID